MRKVEPKLPRIYLQDGSGDLNIYSGSWWMANQTLAASLEYAGYDFTFERGTDGLNANHSSRVFAQSLEWLWS
ncbi:MAG: gluconolactonase, partial [Acidobacteriota bacterium]